MGAIATFDILEMTASVAPVGGKSHIEYAHYKASTGAYDLETGYVDAAGNFIAIASGNPMNSSNALVAEVKVSIKFKETSERYVYTDDDDDNQTPAVLTYIKDTNNVQYDVATVIDKINDLSVDVTVTPGNTSAVKVFALDGDKDSAGAATGTGKAKGTASDTTATHVVSLGGLTTISSTISATLVAYVYVWGGSDAASGLEAETGTPSAQGINVVATEHSA